MGPERLRLLQQLYGEAAGLSASRQLEAILQTYRSRIPPDRRSGLNQADAMLITYPDQMRESGRLPLHSLADFCERYLSGLVSGLHILPFYPYSSDDGFSVIDYLTVEPAFGTWEDITRLGEGFRLMFDAVINHVSAQSAWFQAFLRNDRRYQDYFIVVEGQPDLAQVVRPRALPLLTPFQTAAGEKQVWTTFSADQIDLNYANPQVLLDILQVLLEYAARGAQFIRLDAIAYLWKEPGTSSIHRRQTHWIIRLIRAVLDEVAPRVLLITETNVPHAENVSYLGDGSNEAQLVYNFALPPLVLDAFATGSAETLSAWAASLSLPSRRTAFFNFLASHDGIGLNPAGGILSPQAIDGLVQRALAHGGLVSEKRDPDGGASPYELNINYFDALSDPAGSEPLDLQVDRFIAAQAILLSLSGMPGIYFHSLFGSRGWAAGAKQTGQKRAINRQKLAKPELESQLRDPESLRSRVFSRLARLLRLRGAQPGFHPSGEQRVVECGRAVFAHLRASPDGRQQILCLHNVSAGHFAVQIDLAALGAQGARDLVGGERFTGKRLQTVLRPYQVMWNQLDE